MRLLVFLLALVLLPGLAAFSEPGTATSRRALLAMTSAGQAEAPVCTVEFKQNGSGCNVRLEIINESGQVVVAETFFESDRQVLSLPCASYSYTATVLNPQCLARDFSTVAGLKGEPDSRYVGRFTLAPESAKTITIPNNFNAWLLILLLVLVLAAAVLYIYYRRKA